MHVQVVNLHLKDLSDAEYRRADEATNTYGGIYTWTDRDAMNAFAASDLFKSIVANPNLVGITSRDFSILEGPGVVTRSRVPAAA